MRLILASASPRRRELLAAAGLAFEIDAVPVDETPLAGETAESYVDRLARLKAETGLRRNPSDAVLGADTTVVVDGDILAKPDDEAQATAMLRRLSGRAHEVLTAVALAQRGSTACRVERTIVWVSPLTEAEIAWYVESGEPRDRAGAYAIQGLFSRFVLRLEGSYSNVVGLPVAAVLQILRDTGVDRAIGAWARAGLAARLG